MLRLETNLNQTALLSFCLGAAAAAAAAAACLHCWQRHSSWKVAWCTLVGAQRQHVGPVVDGVEGAIGNTPLIRIKSLSEATGCEVTPPLSPTV